MYNSSQERYWKLRGDSGNELYSKHPAETLRDKLVFRIEEKRRYGGDNMNYYLVFDNIHEYIFFFRAHKNGEIKKEITAHELCSANLPRKLAFDIDIEGKTDFDPYAFMSEFSRSIKELIPSSVDDDISVFSSHSREGLVYLRRFSDIAGRSKDDRHKQTAEDDNLDAFDDNLDGNEEPNEEQSDNEEQQSDNEERQSDNEEAVEEPSEVDWDKLKISYHIVIQNYCMSNCKESALYFEKFQEIYRGNLDIFDKSIYSAEHSLRGYGWKKINTERIKIVDEMLNKTDFGGKINDTIRMSLMSYTIGTKYLPILGVRITDYESVEIDDDNVRDAIAAFHDADSFEFKSVKDGVIILTRIKSSMCSVCDRVHDNNNGYLRILPDGGVLFGCHQNKSSYIGDINLEKKRPSKKDKTRKKGTGRIILDLDEDDDDDTKERVVEIKETVRKLYIDDKLVEIKETTSKKTRERFVNKTKKPTILKPINVKKA